MRSRSQGDFLCLKDETTQEDSSCPILYSQSVTEIFPVLRFDYVSILQVSIDGIVTCMLTSSKVLTEM